MSEFKIEKTVPLPKAILRYPFSDMDIGNSFTVSGGSRNSVASAAAQFGQQHNRKFTVRKTDGVIRIWRTE